MLNYRTILTQGISKTIVLQLITDINNDAFKLEQLLTLITSTDVSAGAILLNYRVSWVISHCGINFPTLFTTQVIDTVLNPIHNKQQHSGYTRNVIRACQDLNFANNINANLVNTVFDVACNNSETIAARAFAITTIEHIGKYEPDILRELVLLLNPTLAYMPRSVKYRAQKAMQAYDNYQSKKGVKA
jgi:hypothetical protein